MQISLMMSDCSSPSADETMAIDDSCKQMLTNAPECNGSMMPGVSTVISPAHNRKLEKTMEALSLVSVRALFALVLWYLFSFGAIFLNKYVVDMLNAEMIIFCKYILHFDVIANVQLVSRYVHSFFVNFLHSLFA